VQTSAQGETRTVAPVPVRFVPVWARLTEALTALRTDGRPVRVLDCGGGSGTFAVPLAQQGAQVTVVDISADALATLTRRAAETGVAGSVTAVQGDADNLAEAIGDDRFDLVLAHDILGAVDSVSRAFDGIATAVRPGGRLSVVVGNPVFAVLAKVLSGDLAAALGELRSAGHGFGPPGPDAIRALLPQAGLIIEHVQGVGVFTDLVPGAALDLPGNREVLAALETEGATRPPFGEIASRIHLLAHRPA
jgi:SAM-dependent methyltransferase